MSTTKPAFHFEARILTIKPDFSVVEDQVEEQEPDKFQKIDHQGLDPYIAERANQILKGIQKERI